MPLVSLESVTKRFGNATAVRQLSLHADTGDVLCLLGPNGAGKTTTLKLVLGLERPTEGRVQVNGIDMAENPADARRQIAYIPEMVALHEAFSGMENLRYFTSLIGGSDLSSAHLEHCLERSGLQKDAWDRRLGDYSKGMRQKVGVAIALAKSARLLVLDEPTSGLDPKSAFEFAGLVSDIAASGAGVVMATHDLFRAKDMATRILILKDGAKVKSIDPATRSYKDIESEYLGVFEPA